jgi:hypothetical protein
MQHSTATRFAILHSGAKIFPFRENLPYILHTSQKSLAAGLRHYHLSFGTEKYPTGTYFNPVDDIIYFESERCEDEIYKMVGYYD